VANIQHQADHHEAAVGRPAGHQPESAATLNYLDIMSSPRKPGSPLPDLPLAPQVHDLFQQKFSSTQNTTINANDGDLREVLKQPGLNDQQRHLIHTLMANSTELTALSRGIHVPYLPGQISWNPINDGITEGDVAQFDQYQRDFDRAAKQNPELAKANAIFEFATRHMDQLSTGTGSITPAEIQKQLAQHGENDTYGKMLRLISDEMPALAQAELVEAEKLAQLGLGGVPRNHDPMPAFVTQSGLQEYALEAYKRATGAGAAEAYHAKMVLNVRQDEMHDPHYYDFALHF
jgi:hypothetical protein